MFLSPKEQPTLIQADELLIRRMRQRDVPEIMAIESVSFGRHHWSEESFLNEMKNQLGRYYSLFHKKDTKLIGYCGYWIIFDEVHITTVAVNPDLRGASLGELLLVQMLERGMGQSVKWVTLEVRVSNTKAQNLYYKYGFQAMGVRPKYYQDNNEDAMIMTTPDIMSETFRMDYNKSKHLLGQKIGGFPEGFGQ
jgi:ribosomal-protein-alanine N-acetyltransferase